MKKSEKEVQKVIRKVVRPGMVVYDVGAFTGVHTILFSKLVGENGLVYAFEPVLENIEKLTKNILGLGDNVIVVNRAVSDIIGTEGFLLHKGPSMGKLEGSVGRRGNYEGKIKVSCTTLDDFSNWYDYPDVVKIDVEGGEIKVIQGMERLFLQSPPVLIIETHGCKEEVSNMLIRFYNLETINEEGFISHILGIPKNAR